MNIREWKEEIEKLKTPDCINKEKLLRYLNGFDENSNINHFWLNCVYGSYMIYFLEEFKIDEYKHNLYYISAQSMERVLRQYIPQFLRIEYGHNNDPANVLERLDVLMEPTFPNFENDIYNVIYRFNIPYCIYLTLKNFCLSDEINRYTKYTQNLLFDLKRIDPVLVGIEETNIARDLREKINNIS